MVLCQRISRSRGISTICPVVRAWVAVEEDVSSGSRNALSWRKCHVGRAQLHFHILGYKGRLGTDSNAIGLQTQDIAFQK